MPAFPPILPPDEPDRTDDPAWTCCHCGHGASYIKERGLQFAPLVLVIVGLGAMFVSIPIGAGCIVAAFIVPARHPEMRCTACKGQTFRRKKTDR